MTTHSQESSRRIIPPVLSLHLLVQVFVISIASKALCLLLLQFQPPFFLFVPLHHTLAPFHLLRLSLLLLSLLPRSFSFCSLGINNSTLSITVNRLLRRFDLLLSSF